MTPSLATATIITLSVLLAVVSALAGALWWRVRSAPLIRAAWLARELAERQEALESLIARLEPQPRSPRRGAVSTANPSRTSTLRADPPVRDPIPGPTLIEVPDMSATGRDDPARGADLASRYGPIWDLAGRGESADAISRSTGLPIGQIELILGLRRRAETTGAGAR